MAVTFDPGKSALNVSLPGRAGLSFDTAVDFDFETALIRQDTRPHSATGRPYPEPRYQGLGRIGRRIVLMVYTPTADGFRVISLRPASKKERATWRANRP